MGIAKLHALKSDEERGTLTFMPMNQALPKASLT